MSYLLLAGKFAHVPGYLSGGSCPEWDAEVATLGTPPNYEEEMAAPGRYCDI